MVKCSLCGRNVNTTAKNYVFANEIHQHRKCKKSPVLSEQEKRDLNELLLAIDWASKKRNLNDVGKDGVNWTLVNKQIKNLKEKGYSYADQLYAFKWLVNRDNGFWGYGRLEKFISKAMEQMKREVDYFAKKAEQSKDKNGKRNNVTVEPREEQNIPARPLFLEGLVDEDLSWL